MSEDRKFCKISPDKVKKGDLMAIVSFVRVSSGFSKFSQELIVDDISNGIKGIRVQGREIIENCFSADQYGEEVETSRTKIAELLISSYNRPLTVSFKKSSGEDRILRGRLIRQEAVLGRSMVEDMDTSDKNKIRLVDHRTISYLIVDGVKYKVKGK